MHNVVSMPGSQNRFPDILMAAVKYVQSQVRSGLITVGVEDDAPFVRLIIDEEDQISLHEVRVIVGESIHGIPITIERGDTRNRDFINQ
jgi:hypothetical protein